MSVMHIDMGMPPAHIIYLSRVSLLLSRAKMPRRKMPFVPLPVHARYAKRIAMLFPNIFSSVVQVKVYDQNVHILT